MTRTKPTSMIVQAVGAGLRLFRWVSLLLFALFMCSGITKVESNEAALLLRFGKLQGARAGTQVKRPGLLLALPYPIDRIVRVPVQEEGEVRIDEVWHPLSAVRAAESIDPLEEGYCLTGDRGIVQARVVVKYILDPIAFRLYTVKPEVILRDAVLAALTQSVCQWRVDDAIRLQREYGSAPGGADSLNSSVWQRAQQRLDELECGMKISALEFKEIHPPRHVIAEFRDVQSAKIEIQTARRRAEGFAAREIPRAQAEQNRLVQAASAHESAVMAKAAAELSVFERLYGEYGQNQDVVRQRLYLETLERILGNVGKLDVVSPEARVILSDEEVGS